MNRRKAIQKIGIGASASFLLPTLFSACKSDDGNGDGINYNGNVIVIGAGVAGLYAADILIKRGISVTVLEAGSRIGGRVKSERGFSDFPVELGSSVVYGQENAWGQLISDYNLQMIDLGEAYQDKYWFNGLYGTATDHQGNPAFVTAQNFVNNLANYNGAGATVQAAAQNAAVDTSAMDMLEGQLGDRYGSDINKIGVSGLKDALNAPTSRAERLIPKGNPQEDIVYSRFSAVQNFIQFNTAVQSINYSGDEITLNTNNGEFTGTKVIVTVPVSILKSNQISFSPSLPSAKTNALSKIGMDAAMKIVMKFNRNFWGQDTDLIFGGALVPMYVSAGIARSANNRVLIAEVYGQAAENFSGMTEEAIKTAIIADLDAIFDGEATTNNAVTRFQVQDWAAEEYIKGGYSYPLAGGVSQDRVDLAATVADKLYFAGEATNTNGNYGTVHGALETAERAAQELIESITA